MPVRSPLFHKAQPQVVLTDGFSAAVGGERIPNPPHFRNGAIMQSVGSLLGLSQPTRRQA